jgi:hypothetical protein
VLPALSGSDVFVKANPKRGLMSRWLTIVSIIVLVIALTIVAIWILSSKKSSPAPVDTEMPSGHTEQANANASPEETKPPEEVSGPLGETITRTTVLLKIEAKRPIPPSPGQRSFEYNLFSASLSVSDRYISTKNVRIGQVIRMENLPCGKQITIFIKPHREESDWVHEAALMLDTPYYIWLWSDTKITRQIECWKENVNLGSIKIKGEWVTVQ